MQTTQTKRPNSGEKRTNYEMQTRRAGEKKWSSIQEKITKQKKTNNNNNNNETKNTQFQAKQKQQQNEQNEPNAETSQLMCFFPIFFKQNSMLK